MNPFKTLSAVAMTIAMLFLSMPALAQGIPYTASFPGATSASLARLSDNDVATPGQNGFFPSGGKGVLTFTFAGDWNVSAFTIWNNINGGIGGVKEFTLTFKDSAGHSLGTVLSQPNLSNAALATSFPNLTYVGVRQVMMDITASHNGRLEVREIRFEGTLSTCCPPSALFPLATLFNSVQGNVTNNYHLNFTANATLDAQMAAYVALLKALDPSVVSMAMTVSAYNGGTAATAAISGAPLETGAVIWVAPPSAHTELWPPAFFTSAANLPTDTWTVIEITVWVLRPGGRFVQACQVRRFAFRPQVMDALRRSRASPSGPSGFVDYTGPAPRTAPAPPAMPPRR